MDKETIQVIKGMTTEEIINAIKTKVAQEKDPEELLNHLMGGFNMLGAKLGKFDT